MPAKSERPLPSLAVRAEAPQQSRLRRVGVFMEPETARSGETEPKRIARTVNVAAISIAEFRANLAARRLTGEPVMSCSWIEAHMIQKSDDSKVSSDKVMFVGGTVGPKETYIDAAEREAAEETTETELHIGRTRDRWQSTPFHRFRYGIDGYDEPRAIDIHVLEVESDDFSINVPREKNGGPTSEDKIKRLVRLSPVQLQQLIDEGSVTKDEETFWAAAHMTNADMTNAEVPDHIDITDTDKVEREHLLNHIMIEVNEFDMRMKRSTIDEINRVRRVRGEESVDWSTVDRCSDTELTRGFVAAQMRMALGDYTDREVQGKRPAKDSLFKVLPYLTSELPVEEFPNLVLSLPNRETVEALSSFQRGMRKGVQVVLDRLEEQFYVADDPTKMYRNKGITEADVREIAEKFAKEQDPMRTLREVWPFLRKQHPQVKRKIILEANEAVVEGLAEAMGVTAADVNNAKDAADEFHDYIKADLTRLGDMGIYQELNPSPDIINARLFTLMAYSIGLHPNRDQQAATEIDARRLRFEALRHLALVRIGAEASQELRRADNLLFEDALDNFFEAPGQAAVMVDKEKQLNVYNSQTKDEIANMHVQARIDERLRKRLLAAMRKWIQDPEMYDISSINIILFNKNFTHIIENPPDELKDKPGDSPLVQLNKKRARDAVVLEAYLDVSEAMREGLKQHTIHFLSDGEPGWSVNVVDGTLRHTSIDKVREIIKDLKVPLKSLPDRKKPDEDKQQKEEAGGKRTGSKADNIIRDKFVWEISGPDGYKEYVELCFYPFSSTDSNRVSAFEALEEQDMMGWEEKVKDQERYEKDRTLKRGGKNPTKHSFIGLFYPGHFYNSLADRIRNMQIESRRKKAGDYANNGENEVYIPAS